MLSRNFLLVQIMLALVFTLVNSCEDKPKKPQKPPYPPVFGDQKPIIRYQVIQESEFTVQVGEDEYDSLYPASVLASRLRAAGVACFIEQAPKDQPRYRVCVGRFPTKERAENMIGVLVSKNIHTGRPAGPFK